jgi:hypothetical protein
MTSVNFIEIGFINIVATPHPTGVYAASLAEASNFPIKYWGSNYAAIRKPKMNRRLPHIWEGVITTWTEINTNEPSIDKETLDSIDVEQELIAIFRRRGFNNKEFYYSFNELTHTIGVELVNDQGKSISIIQIEKIITKAFERISNENQSFEITVFPEEDALEKVFAFQRIDRVTIVLKRPNPGDHSAEDAEEVLKELEEQNIKQATYDFSRQGGSNGIELNEFNEKRARVASSNGHVKARGLVRRGLSEVRSTKEYPYVKRVPADVAPSFKAIITDEVSKFNGE